MIDRGRRDRVAAARRASHAIEIEEFVDLDEIDPLYFEQPYYLVPDERGEKPYKLLVDAMTELNKVAIGRIVMRSKERLVAIRPLDGVLCVETMRYADEVVAARRASCPKTTSSSPNASARWRASSSSRSPSDEFEPEKYHDEYREQLLDLIERKAAGEEIVAEPEVEAPAKVLDLVAALEASLAKAADREGPPPEHVGSQGRRRGDEDERDETKPAPPSRRRCDGQGDAGDEDGQEGAGQEGAREEALGLGRQLAGAGCSSRSHPHSTQITSSAPSPQKPTHGSQRLYEMRRVWSGNVSVGSSWRHHDRG